MPIYEFKCLQCNELFEMLIINKDEQVELKCPRCNFPQFERVISSSNHAMGATSSPECSGNHSRQTRTCSGGSCTTYDIPGPNG